MHLNSRIVKTGALLLLFLPLQLHALPSDKTQPVQVEADLVDLDQLKHKGIYKGNIFFRQGTTQLEAASAFTRENTKHQLIMAIAKGNAHKQAHMQTQTAKDKPPLHAYADTIRYMPMKNLVELRGHARITQGKDSFAAPVIIYNTLKQQLVSKKSGTQKTFIIFHPEKKS